MICPVEIASEMSAFRAARVGDHAKHDQLSEGRSGAGDESTGRDVAGDGEEDYVVGKFAVGSKLKCPVFVAHEMSGLTI